MSGACLLRQPIVGVRPCAVPSASLCSRQLLRRRPMLSETLYTFVRLTSHHKQTGIPARVAQFRPVTGSSDFNSSSQDLQDIEFGTAPYHSYDVDPQLLSGGSDAPAVHPVSSSHADSDPAEKVTRAVQHELRRHRLEAVWQVDSSTLRTEGQQQQQQQQHHDGRQEQLPSRDYSSPVDDELLPLLAEAAVHLPGSKQREQQQQPKQQLAATAAAGPAMMSGGIPRSIFVLSMVSMALTSASCVFNTLLPIYMVTELKMTMRTMGMFEGMLEAFSYVVRMFSGVISDHMSSRKAAITAGFIMGAAAKFGMSFATSTVQLFMTKAVDRLGNGVQAAPRDALIGDLSPSASRSACFGFAQSMRKWGSFMGAGLAFALMKASGNNYRAIFLLAAGVSALSTLAFVTLVPSHPNSNSKSAAGSSETAVAAKQQQQQAPQHPLRPQQQQQPSLATAAESSSSSSSNVTQQWRDNVLAFVKDVCSMGVDYYRTLSVIALYGLGHINESLLEARAIEVGFGKAESTLVVALLCFSVFLCAYPLGKLDDKFGHATTFALGMASLVAGDLVLLLSGQWPAAVFVACGFWGAHWAVVQGPMLSAVVGMAPPHLKGTAFGIFYSMMALVALAANTMFGSVWHAHSATAAFALSAVIIMVTMVLTPLLLPDSAKVGRHVAAAAAPPAGAGFKPGPA